MKGGGAVAPGCFGNWREPVCPSDALEIVRAETLSLSRVAYAIVNQPRNVDDDGARPGPDIAVAGRRHLDIAVTDEN